MSSIDINNPPRRDYKVIYADPAWKFNESKTGGSMSSAAEQKYTVTTIEEMKALPVNQLTGEDCLLVMWWVGSMPDEALDLARSWGFRVVNMNGFVWGKLTKNGLPHFGMGHSTRAGSESALIGVKGKLKNIIRDRSVRAVIETDGDYIKAKVGRHSEKPAIFRKEIERMCGLVRDVPRLEMFARETTTGWDVWGNEV